MVSNYQSATDVKRAVSDARMGRRPVVWAVPRARLMLCWLLLACSATAQDLSEMRIRIAWGGGEHVAWQGQIKVDGGRFVAPQCLGSEPDAWAGLITQGDTIRIDSRRPQSYQALDVTVRAPLASNLIIEMRGATVAEEPQTITVPLTQLRDESFNLPIDTLGNRMLVRRAPGDRLRVSMARDQLVFSPGEQWPLEIQPWLINRDGFRPANLQARLVPARSDQTLWRKEARLEKEASGEWRSVGMTVPIPKEEGSYDLVLRATPPRGMSLLPTDKAAMEERRVQFVVIDPMLPGAESANVDPGKSSWAETLAFDPSAKPQLSLSPMRIRGQGHARAARLGERIASVLGPEQWQTYPLPILKAGVPHMIEVDCLGGSTSSLRQGLGISVVEPTANGSQRVQSFDAASDMSSPSASVDGTHKVRLIFWPQTRDAQLLLTNLSLNDEVAFGQIRLLQGASRLPPRGPRQADHGFRTVFAHIDDPQFYRSFSSTLAMDTEANRELTDWVTFQQGGQRMVDYLRYVGMSGVSLTCVAEGGSLAPLTTTAGIPRHDTGVYLSAGQDAFSKDVLEMLLRMFDREDLKLQIGVQFATPLVQLEAIRATGNAVGIDLTDDRGQAFRETSAGSRTAGYNPLDPRVQQAMLGVIRELSSRYSRHKSFAGVRVDLSADGYTQLPGLEWGCDPQTVAIFQQEMAAELPPELRTELQPSQLLSGPLQPLWIAWRQKRMSEFYAAIVAEVRRTRPDAQVALHLTPLVEGGLVAAASHPGSPTQTTIEQSLGIMGIDLNALSSIRGISILRPFAAAPLMPLAEQGKWLQFAQSAVWQKANDAEGAYPSAAISNRTLRLSPRNLDIGKLFGTPSSEMLLRPRLTFEQRNYRSSLNQALAAGDVQSLTIGGDSLLTDGDSEFADWIDVYRRLPAQPFKRFQSSEADDTDTVIATAHPVSVGTLSIAGRTYVYAVNESEWPVDTALSVAANSECRIMDLGPGSTMSQWQNLAKAQPAAAASTAPTTTGAVAVGPPSPNSQTSPPSTTNGWRWNVRLKPYQLVAQVLTDPDAAVVRVASQIQADVVPGLQQRLVDATSRLNVIKQPVPYQGLVNAGFDTVPPAVEIPGWQWPREPQINVARDTVVRHDGTASLRMESSGPVAWVRSQPLPVPRSGRLALQAMVRFEPETPGSTSSRAPFRLALEGTYQGRPYYRFAEVTAPAAAAEVASRPGAPQASTSPQPPSTSPRGALPLPPNRREPVWAPFMLQVNDLPVDDLEQLQVRFDLMGPGRVWVDDVRLFDLSLTPDEQLEVSKVIALADFQLRSGRPADCAATLDRYWPLFLTEFVPTPNLPTPFVPNGATQNPTRPANRRFVPRTGFLKRLKGALSR